MRFAVLGDPIGHSRSPAMHAAAYRALGMSHSYEAIRVPGLEPRALADKVNELRAGTFDGFSITVPHKVSVLSYVDEVSDIARSMGAANTLVRAADGRIVAHNTDGPALRDELATLAGFSPGVGLLSKRCAIVLGSGGAARSAVWALRALGCTRVVVRGRSVGPETAVRDFSVTPLTPTDDDARASIVVQTTSAGMRGGDPGDDVARAVAWSKLPPEAVALDAIYGVETPFLRAARAREIPAVDGLGMLVGQGALAFTLWLGVPAPVAAMRAALEPGAS